MFHLHNEELHICNKEISRLNALESKQLIHLTNICLQSYETIKHREKAKI